MSTLPAIMHEGIIYCDQAMHRLKFFLKEQKDERLNDPARIRTWNPLIRSQMPYPLGHGAFVVNVLLLQNVFSLQSVAAASVGNETLEIRKEKKHWLLNHIEHVSPNFVHPVRGVG